MTASPERGSPGGARSDAKKSGAELGRDLDRRLARAALVANGLGALDLYLFLSFVLPLSVDSDDGNRLLLWSSVAGAVYLVVTLVVGTRWARRRSAPMKVWLEAERPAEPHERELALRQPIEFVIVSGTFWVIAALMFAAIMATASLTAALIVAVTVVLGGLTVVALGYLLAERIARPVTARALASGLPERPLVPGVTTRLTMAWLLATGVPVLGIVALAAADLLGADLEGRNPAGAMLFLGGLALCVGLGAIVGTARSVSDPIAALRKALGRVEGGDYSARARVDDGSEVGLLEAGFNRMAEGLEERERTRDLFGRHVGEEVARAALDGDLALGGEEREVAALFVDVVGSTELAHERPATEVVTMLNAFFGIVVAVTEEFEGLVNKFEGDGALCVFGAPVATSGAPANALAAARALSARLAAELPAIEVGIGVSSGTAVAGNVGAERRFEYTVIGDPVNEASRLCELAKQRSEDVLAAGGTIAEAGAEESAYWTLGESVTLRGRSAPTVLASVRVGGPWREKRQPEPQPARPTS